MYVKRHAVVKDGKRYVYLRLVEAYRDEDGRVRHRVLRTLGREDELKASGQLEQLAASFARLDPPPVGTRRHVGPLLLVAHYLGRLGLVDRSTTRSDAGAGHADPRGGDRRAGGQPACGAGAAVRRGGLGILGGDRRIVFRPSGIAQRRPARPGAGGAGPGGRAGARRAGPWPPRPLRGRPVPAAPGHDRGPVHRRLRPARRWWPRGGPPTAPSPAKSRPCRCPPAPGSRSTTGRIRGRCNEAPCFADALERIRELAPPGVVCVIDSGFGHLSKLCAADAAGLRFVVPLRADTGWAGWFAADVPDGLAALARLDHCSQRERRLPEHQRTVWKGVLREHDIADDDTGATHRLRIAYIWSSEEAASVADARERALTTAEDALTRSATASAGATTKPASRSTTGSPRSSDTASPT